MIDFTSYNHAYFLKTSEVLLKNAQSTAEGRFYYCLSSIAFSAFTIEAFVNHCGIYKESDSWKKWDQTRPFPKFNQKLKRLGVSKGNFSSDLKEIFKIRDYIAHGRPDTIIYEEVPEDIEFESLLSTDFEKQITLQKAEYFFEFVKNFMSHINKDSGCNLSNDELFHIFGEGGGIY